MLFLSGLRPLLDPTVLLLWDSPGRDGDAGNGIVIEALSAAAVPFPTSSMLL